MSAPNGSRQGAPVRARKYAPISSLKDDASDALPATALSAIPAHVTPSAPFLESSAPSSPRCNSPAASAPKATSTATASPLQLSSAAKQPDTPVADPPASPRTSRQSVDSSKTRPRVKESPSLSDLMSRRGTADTGAVSTLIAGMFAQGTGPAAAGPVGAPARLTRAATFNRDSSVATGVGAAQDRLSAGAASTPALNSSVGGTPAMSPRYTSARPGRAGLAVTVPATSAQSVLSTVQTGAGLSPDTAATSSRLQSAAQVLHDCLLEPGTGSNNSSSNQSPQGDGVSGPGTPGGSINVRRSSNSTCGPLRPTSALRNSAGGTPYVSDFIASPSALLAAAEQIPLSPIDHRFVTTKSLAQGLARAVATAVRTSSRAASSGGSGSPLLAGRTRVAGAMAGGALSTPQLPITISDAGFGDSPSALGSPMQSTGGALGGGPSGAPRRVSYTGGNTSGGSNTGGANSIGLGLNRSASGRVSLTGTGSLFSNASTSSRFQQLPFGTSYQRAPGGTATCPQLPLPRGATDEPADAGTPPLQRRASAAAAAAALLGAPFATGGSALMSTPAGVRLSVPELQASGDLTPLIAPGSPFQQSATQTVTAPFSRGPSNLAVAALPDRSINSTESNTVSVSGGVSDAGAVTLAGGSHTRVSGSGSVGVVGEEGESSNGTAEPKPKIVSNGKAGSLLSDFQQLNGVLNATAWQKQLLPDYNVNLAPTPDAAHFKRRAQIRSNQEARDKTYR